MDDVIILISESVTGHDTNGNEVITQNERQVFCKVRSVTRSEFYSAAQVNLRPEYIFVLSDMADYEGEKLVRFRGVLYSVVRTFMNTANLGEIELTVERKIGNG